MEVFAPDAIGVDLSKVFVTVGTWMGCPPRVEERCIRVLALVLLQSSTYVPVF